ncbi:MAG: M16 family metallopeptidase [Gammaproteobacteria bacterium]
MTISNKLKWLSYHMISIQKYAYLLIKNIAIIGLLMPTMALAFSSNVHSYQLKNGLMLLVKEDHRSPVVSNQLWYHVGSSYEPNGITGISHALEHMMFKGTTTQPVGAFSQHVAQLGGQENAATAQDFTFYYQEVPVNGLEKMLALEADRMANLIVDKKEFAKEIQVVMEERRMRIDNDPISSTLERFNAAAFRSIPYHHPIIGWMSDLQQLTADNVENWYKQWYGPNNATLVIVGDVKPSQVYTLVKQYFGALPAVTLPTIKKHQALSALGIQRLTVHKPAKIPFIVLGFHTPSVPALTTASKEPYALEVLNYLLVGSDSGRLPKALIRDNPIVSTVNGSYNLYSRLPTLFTLHAIPSEGHSSEEVEKAIMKQLAYIKNKSISITELDRIKAQVIAHHIYGQDSIAHQGMLLGSLASVGLSWKEINNYLKQIQKITPNDVQTVAKKYLQPNNLTVATLVPLVLDETSAP